MRDTVAIGTFSGFIGTLVLNLFTFLVQLLGIKTSSPWDVATVVFLNARYLGTVSGYVIGFAGSLALGIAVGIFTALVIKVTGHDYAWLKGILCAEAMGFAGIGFIAPLLGVAGFLKNEPATNIYSIFGLLVFGLTVGFVIRRYGVESGQNIR